MSRDGTENEAAREQRSGCWRLIRYPLLVVLLLILVGSCWLLADGDVPVVDEVFPDGGEWIQLDIPRGRLDARLERLLRESWIHLSLAGASLGRDPLPDPTGTGVILRTRPWRIGVWRAPGVGSILVVAAQGLDRVTSRIETKEAVIVAVGGRDLWAHVSGSVLLVSDDRELLMDARQRLASARRERIGDDFALRMSTPGAGGDLAGGVTEFVPLPPGTTAIDARLEPADGTDQWRLSYSLERSNDATVPGTEPGPWGPESWRDLVERENVSVELLGACARGEAPGVWEGTWKLTGVGRAVDRLSDRIAYWNGR